MLEMPQEWRFGSPGALAPATVSDLHDLILKVTAQRDSWSLLELFKSRFNGGASPSSDEGWARSDLRTVIFGAAENAPAFIDALWSACGEIANDWPGVSLPDARTINAILVSHGEPYEIRPPRLVARTGVEAPVVAVPDIGLGERATALIGQTLGHADQLLMQGRSRQAVQEVLWLLETVSTAFEGCETQTGGVEGKYFNTIVRDLRRHHPNTILSEALGWTSKLHGFLSSPTGGGVRHGTSILADRELTTHEAALFCNLTRSYIGYLLAELASRPAVQA